MTIKIILIASKPVFIINKTINYRFNSFVYLSVLQGYFCGGHGIQGPVFLQEPPSTLTFSNTTGSQVSCSVHGSPTPQVDWIMEDGHTVSAVPGLR